MTQVQKPEKTTKIVTSTPSTVATPPKIVPSVPIYQGMEPEMVEQLESYATVIEENSATLMRVAVYNGKQLLEVRTMLQAHNKETKAEGFERWCQERLNYTVQYANAFIRVYEHHASLPDDQKNVFLALPKSIQMLLSSPETPKEAVEATLAVTTETGMKAPSVNQVKATIGAAKEIRKTTSQPAKVVDLKKVATAKKPHGNTTAVKSTSKEPTQPKAPTPTSKEYSPSENGVVLERIHADLLALKPHIGPNDKPDVFLLKADVEALISAIARQIVKK